MSKIMPGIALLVGKRDEIHYNNLIFWKYKKRVLSQLWLKCIRFHGFSPFGGVLG